MVALRTLNLSNNQISSIEANTFKELVNLNELWLNGNQLTLIENLFQGLVSLTWLDLSRNKLESIEQNAFNDLTNLFTLNLSNNKINSIDVKSFIHLNNLNDLWLQDNQIKAIDVKMFKDLLNLNWLDLSHNLLNESDKTNLKESLINLDVLNIQEDATEKRKRDKLKEIFKLNFLSSDKAAITTSQIKSSSRQTDKSQVLMRNFLRNACGEDDFNFWLNEINNWHSDERNINPNQLDSKYFKKLIKLYKNSDERNSKDFWQLETEQNGAPKQLFREDGFSLFANFSTTYYSGRKSQLIDLLSVGVDETFMKNVRPSISVGEHYSARFDCGSEYHLNVFLIDKKFEIVDEFLFNDSFPQWYDGEWRQIKHKFTYKSSYDSIRYILFRHSGKVRPFK